MKRLAPLLLAVAILLALAGVVSAPVGSAGAPVAAPDPRPNILLVMTDDQTFESIASMPFIRALADRGTKFTNYHASFPLCCPSRATTLTGQYAHHHGVWRNGGPEGGYTAFEPGAGNSLSVWLQDAGYKTMMVGKFLNGYDVGDGVPPGWDRWRVWNRSTDGNSRYHDVPLVYEDGKVHQTTGYSTLTYRKQATHLVDERPRATVVHVARLQRAAFQHGCGPGRPSAAAVPFPSRAGPRRVRGDQGAGVRQSVVQRG